VSRATRGREPGSKAPSLKPAVFLDSGIFIAFMNSRDRWHPSAVALFGGKKPKWFTSLAVISETYSWFLHRMGEESARNFRLLIDSLVGLEVLELTREHHEGVVKMLEKLRGAKLSYVDASSLVFMSQKKIRQVWSTDHHLGLTGAEVQPRV
jgi:predicted nucleic acid-binding protein